MIVVGIGAALIVLAVITQVGVAMLERLYPRQGQWVDVAGARLNVVDAGPRTDELPIVLIHGISKRCSSLWANCWRATIA